MPWLEGLRLAIKSLLAEGDPLGLAAATDALGSALKGTDTNALAVAHDRFLQRLDATLTLAQKGHGDPADIPQTVRFQSELFSSALAGRPGAADVVEACRRALAKWGRGPVDGASYAELLRATLPDLRVDSSDPAALQREHLLHLWKLEEAGP
jgi:hypothetical protein